MIQSMFFKKMKFCILVEYAMKRKLLSLFAVGCVIAIMVMIPVSPVSALEMEYFPLAPGGSLIFNSTNDDGTWMTKRYIDEE